MQLPTKALAAVIFLLALCASAAPARPTLWIIGDSTVNNGTPGQEGWGSSLDRHFDISSIGIVNRAIGGRSSRTFLTEGRWDAVLAHLRPGDYVLMQFGHNDGGEIFTSNRPRASIKGTGEESVEGTVEQTGKRETVRTFGWYMRKYATDTIARGAVPIIASAIPRNKWSGGKVVRNDHDYGLWAEQAASETGARFLPLNRLLAESWEALGPEKTAALFDGSDHTHTNPEGARFNSRVVASAIRDLADCNLRDHLHPAGLWLPSVFSDHMVLQRDLPLPVWGSAIPGSRVTATIAGKTAATDADDSGRWRLDLPPLPAGGPHVLEVSTEGAKLGFRDVLVGEVWLCSGQSNMDFTVARTAKRSFAGTRDSEAEIAAAGHPGIRMFTAEWSMHDFPRNDVEGTWKVCTPETVGDFSAVAYFFGRDLHRTLEVPVGLVTCALGASTAEAWISEARIAAHPQLKELLEAYGKKRIAFRDDPAAMEKYGKALADWRDRSERAAASGDKIPRKPSHLDPVQDQHNPGVLFNGMISPVVPYAIRGAIWYQGESNVGTRSLYPELQKTLIGEWRDLWNRDDLPFYFVQLASYREPAESPGDSGLASMREAQASSLTLPHTGMVVATDLGEARDIHPRNKQDVGHRLALLALADTYGETVEARGPAFARQTVEAGKIRLHFDHTADGLVARGGPLKRFAISGSDRKFYWAEASIDGDTVVVESPEVPTPAFVRYAWADNPEGANLYNSAGLPAAPFRTDR